jgi:hypothetical protein
MPERSNEKRNGGNRKSSRPITQQFRCTPRRATARCQVGPYKSEQIVGPLEKAPERAQIWDQTRTEEPLRRSVVLRGENGREYSTPFFSCTILLA